MRERVLITDSILSCMSAGNWIIVECHVNPYQSAYEFYNTVSGDFEYEILGATLKWQQDDLSTAIYFLQNQIFDFWGNLIGSVENGEVYGLQFAGDDTILAKCRAVDENGKEYEFTQEFEYEPHDKEVLAYYEYLLGDSSKWDALLKDAPDKAAAFLMVNPPKMILDRKPKAQVIDAGSYDRVVVVSLFDDEKVQLRPYGEDGTGKDSGRRYAFLNQGFKNAANKPS